MQRTWDQNGIGYVNGNTTGRYKMRASEFSGKLILNADSVNQMVHHVQGNRKASK
jgi:hypothetical protein